LDGTDRIFKFVRINREYLELTRNWQTLWNYTPSHLSNMAGPLPAGEIPASPSIDFLKGVFNAVPDQNILHPAHLPPKPALFDEVKFAPPLSEDSAYLARQFWQEPDNHLGTAWKGHQSRPYVRPDDDEPDMHVLAHNVYEHLMSNPFLPQSREDADINYTNEGLDTVYNGVQGLRALTENMFISGKNIQDEAQWTIATLKVELKSRGLSEGGRKADLQERLWRYEVDQQAPVLSQSDLNKWGINRNTPILSPATSTTLNALDMYTSAIYLSPYNPTYWTSRAYDHYLRGFSDLAIGDAHRSNLLCEVLTTATQRNKRPGLYTRVWDAIQMHIMAGSKLQNTRDLPEIHRMRKANGINYFIPTLLNANHNIISLCLASMHCWDNYELHLAEHKRRNLQFRDIEVPEKRKKVLDPIIQDMLARKEKPQGRYPSRYPHEWMAGCVSGRVRYPYQQTDVDRRDPNFLRVLNANVFPNANATMAAGGLCEARAKTRNGTPNGLGVFATGVIPAGSIIHYEEPVIRSHILPNKLKGDKTNEKLDYPRCENCKASISSQALNHLKRSWPFITGAEPNPNGISHPLDCGCSCMIYAYNKGGRNDIPAPVFCHNNISKGPGAKMCKDIALECWAFGNRDIEWGWLYDCMRAPIFQWNGRDYFSSHHEKHGTHLSLLLKHVFELTLHRREHRTPPPATSAAPVVPNSPAAPAAGPASIVPFPVAVAVPVVAPAARTASANPDDDKIKDPNLLAHEINELLMLETGTDADAPWENSWFPFTMSGNIRVPFDILSALGVDIFRDFSFDTWVIQLVLRKLHINAVPWSPSRRGGADMFTKNDDHNDERIPYPHEQESMRAGGQSFSKLRPSITDLYLFPGLSMFNHTCRGSENATWAYDSVVQNRVVVYATREINANEEILLPYRDLPFPGLPASDIASISALQMFGRSCECDQCTATGEGSKRQHAAETAKILREERGRHQGKASGSGTGAGPSTGASAAARTGFGAGAAAESGDAADDQGGDGAGDEELQYEMQGPFKVSKEVTRPPEIRPKPVKVKGRIQGKPNKKLQEAIEEVYKRYPEYHGSIPESEESSWGSKSIEVEGGDIAKDDDGDIVLEDV
jgi:hypothetical protein